MAPCVRILGMLREGVTPVSHPAAARVNPPPCPARRWRRCSSLRPRSSAARPSPQLPRGYRQVEKQDNHDTHVLLEGVPVLVCFGLKERKGKPRNVWCSYFKARPCRFESLPSPADFHEEKLIGTLFGLLDSQGNPLDQPRPTYAFARVRSAVLLLKLLMPAHGLIHASQPSLLIP